jgi:hypothetical protein
MMNTDNMTPAELEAEAERLSLLAHRWAYVSIALTIVAVILALLTIVLSSL